MHQGHVLVGQVNHDKLPDLSKVLGNEDRGGKEVAQSGVSMIKTTINIAMSS